MRREREKAGENTENKGGNCQGEQENLRVSFLVLPLLLQLAVQLTSACLIEQWCLKIKRHPVRGAVHHFQQDTDLTVTLAKSLLVHTFICCMTCKVRSESEAAGESYCLRGNMHRLANDSARGGEEESLLKQRGGVSNLAKCRKFPLLRSKVNNVA